MKRFIGFVKKEFYHIFRDKRSLFILFGMPIAQILLFGFAITNEINNVDIAILDQSNDIETQKIIDKDNSYVDAPKEYDEWFNRRYRLSTSANLDFSKTNYKFIEKTGMKLFDEKYKGGYKPTF